MPDSTNTRRIDSNPWGQSVAPLRRRVLRRVVIAAHRGFSTQYPDNSVDAFEAAIAAGADLIETDVRMSADGILYCHHDPDVDGALVEKTRSAEMDRFGVTRLSAALSLARARVGVLLDLKIESVAFGLSVLQQVRDADAESQTVFGVRSIEQASVLRQESRTAVLLGFLADYGTFPAFFENGGDIARLWEEDLTPRLLASARNKKHPVWITTRRGKHIEPAGAIDAPRLETLLQLGVDGVLVNDPAAAVTMRERFYGSETA